MVVALCSGCGSSEGGKPRGEDIPEGATGWRLVHTDANYPSYWRGNTLEFAAANGDTSFTYDSDNEIVRIESFYIEPRYFAVAFTNSQVSDIYPITPQQASGLGSTSLPLGTQVISSSIYKPYFNEGELAASIDFINTSDEAWTEIFTYWLKSSRPYTENSTCDGEIVDSDLGPISPYGDDIINEGRETRQCIHKAEFSETREVTNWGESIIQTDATPFPDNQLPDVSTDLSLPQPAPTVHEFNTNGKLRKLTQFTVANGNDSAPGLVADFTYNDQNRLSLLTIEKTHYYFNQTTAGLEWFSASQVFETYYGYPSPGIVTATIYQITDSGSVRINEATATYENQSCGAITHLRDSRQVPALFPVCL